MKTLYKTCLLTGTLFAFSPSHALAEDVHASHHEHGMTVGTATHQHNHSESLTPLRVMGDHAHDKGEWMVSYQFKRMHMEGNRQGRDSISNEAIVTTITNPSAPPPTLRVVPTEMDMDMHMFGAMYGLTDKVTLMAMAMYMDNSMKHLTYAGMAGTTELGRFTTRSSGWGDTRISGIYNLYQTPAHNVNISLGVSAPTGSIKEEDTVLTPMNTTPVLRLPYAMQLGSGTWDGLVGMTYTGHTGAWSWGAQYNGTFRLENENSQNYRWGDKHDLTVWGGHRFNDQWGVTTHIAGETMGKIKGSDANIAAPVQTANPDNYGGERMEIGTGFTYTPSIKSMEGIEIGAEISIPIYQNLHGVQMERDWNASIGISYTF
ncbi:MAG: transporter [Alphaproteobacteria bacterium]